MQQSKKAFLMPLYIYFSFAAENSLFTILLIIMRYRYFVKWNYPWEYS